jgi:hypothetical protein
MRDETRFVPVLVGFWALRLMMLVTFPPQDLMVLGDYPYYYALAQFSDDGLLPFIGYWSEHLPLFPFLSVGLYRLSHLLPGAGYDAYAYLLGTVMTAVDCLSLVLFLRLARRTWDAPVAERLGWTVSILFVPLIFSFWTFEPLTTFFVLLALYLLLRGRDGGSALALGLGALTKLVPLLVVPAVILAHPRRRWLPYVLVIAVVVGAVAVLLLALGGEYAIVSFRSVLARNSYETVWALIDGYLTTGLVAPAESHLDPASVSALAGNPARVPFWLKTALFALLGLFVFLQADLRDAAPRRTVAFVALTLVIFFLWSKGWSPQWQLFLFPLVLLSLPYRRAFFFVMALSIVNILEWPLLLSRGIGVGLYLTVPLRTALFVALGLALWKQVRRTHLLSPAAIAARLIRHPCDPDPGEQRDPLRERS